jgi:hypothetical protein
MRSTMTGNELSKTAVALLAQKDTHGKTALDWARVAKQTEVAHFIEKVKSMQHSVQVALPWPRI